MDHIQFPSQQIGEFSITAISDGYLSASLDLLSNIDLLDASKLQQDPWCERPLFHSYQLLFGSRPGPYNFD